MNQPLIFQGVNIYFWATFFFDQTAGVPGKWVVFKGARDPSKMFQKFGGALGTYTNFGPEIWFNDGLVLLPEKIGLPGSQIVPNRKLEDKAMA